MRKLMMSVWMTMDGAIGADSMDQCFKPYRSDARGKYIHQSASGSDALLIGPTTYEMLVGDWPYQKGGSR